MRHQDSDSARLVELDSTRLCWCVCTAASAIVSKPQSQCRVFVSLTGLDWTRLDSTLLVCTHPKIHFGSTFSPIYSSPRQSLLFRLSTLISIVNETVAFRVQNSKRQYLTRVCYFSNEVCSQRRHLVQRRELLKVKFALKQAIMAQRESISIALPFL
jgi:hypothetical protein